MQLLFNSKIGHDILMNVFEYCIILVIYVVLVLFNLYLKQKKKGFQSGALLKMHPSSHSMEEFGLYI